MLKTAPIYACVPVHDFERARRFYEDTLALGPARSVGPALSFACGGGTTCLMYPSLNAELALGACGFWQVDDFEGVVAWLRDRGVPPDEVREDAAWFSDSEGNRMAVMRAPGGTRRHVRHPAREPVVRARAKAEVAEEAALAA